MSESIHDSYTPDRGSPGMSEGPDDRNLSNNDPRDTEEYPFVDKTKWCLIKKAPLTASGYNEIVATGEYRSQLITYAKAIGVKIYRSQYAIVKMPDEIL